MKYQHRAIVLLMKQAPEFLPDVMKSWRENMEKFARVGGQAPDLYMDWQSEMELGGDKSFKDIVGLKKYVLPPLEKSLSHNPYPSASVFWLRMANASLIKELEEACMGKWRVALLTEYPDPTERLAKIEQQIRDINLAWRRKPHPLMWNVMSVEWGKTLCEIPDKADAIERLDNEISQGDYDSATVCDHGALGIKWSALFDSMIGLADFLPDHMGGYRDKHKEDFLKSLAGRCDRHTHRSLTEQARLRLARVMQKWGTQAKDPARAVEIFALASSIPCGGFEPSQDARKMAELLAQELWTAICNPSFKEEIIGYEEDEDTEEYIPCRKALEPLDYAQWSSTVLYRSPRNSPIHKQALRKVIDWARQEKDYRNACQIWQIAVRHSHKTALSREAWDGCKAHIATNHDPEGQFFSLQEVLNEECKREFYRKSILDEGLAMMEDLVCSLPRGKFKQWTTPNTENDHEASSYFFRRFWWEKKRLLERAAQRGRSKPISGQLGQRPQYHVAAPKRDYPDSPEFQPLPLP